MKYKEVIVGFLLVFLLGVAEYFLLKYGAPKWLSLFFIFLFSPTKVLYIVVKCFRRIVTISHLDLPYHRFLLFIAANVSLIVFSFSFDYLSIYTYDPTSFSG